MTADVTFIDDLASYTRQLGERARDASRDLARATGAQKNRWLKMAADRIRQQADAILEANGQDIARAPEFGLSLAQIDRLKLTSDRVDGIIVGTASEAVPV